MKSFRILIMALATVLLTGCATIQRNATLAPDRTLLQVQMQDLVCLGEVEVSVDYHTYLGLFRKVDRINGEWPDALHKSYTHLDGIGHQGPSLLCRAYAKALQTYPEARYFQIVRLTKTSDRLFLATETHCSALVRAYKFRDAH